VSIETKHHDGTLFFLQAGRYQRLNLLLYYYYYYIQQHGCRLADGTAAGQWYSRANYAIAF